MVEVNRHLQLLQARRIELVNRYSELINKISELQASGPYNELPELEEELVQVRTDLVSTIDEIKALSS